MKTPTVVVLLLTTCSSFSLYSSAFAFQNMQMHHMLRKSLVLQEVNSDRRAHSRPSSENVAESEKKKQSKSTGLQLPQAPPSDSPAATFTGSTWSSGVKRGAVLCVASETKLSAYNARREDGIHQHDKKKNLSPASRCCLSCIKNSSTLRCR